MSEKPQVKTQHDISKEIARKLDKTQVFVKEVVNAFLNEVKLQLKEENSVVLQGFAKFEIKPNNKINRDPRTGAVLPHKEKRVAVRISPVMKKEVL